MSAAEVPLAITGTAFSGIVATIRLAQLSIAISEAPVAAQTFVRLVQRVEKDLEHALSCRIDCDAVLDKSPPSYEEWIADTINDTLAALDDVGKVLLRESKKHSTSTSAPATSSVKSPGHNFTEASWDSLSERFMFVLRDHEKLKDQERALRYSHATLLTAISGMHTMIFHGKEATFGPGRITRADSRPRYSMSQRPSTESAKSLHGVAAPPYSVEDPLSVGTGAVGVQTGKRILQTWLYHKLTVDPYEAQINLARLKSLRSKKSIRDI